MSDQIYDVLIAGAGPVGLLLACELRQAGDVSVLVVERDQDPSDVDTPWKKAPLGMRGINTLSAEALDRRGLLDQIMGEQVFGKRNFSFAESGFSGHFAGMMFDAAKVDRKAEYFKYKLPGPGFSPAPTSLEKMVSALYKRAKALGVEIIGGVDVTGTSQDEGAEEVVLHAASDKSFRGRYLVGCDGGRSKVRKSAGFEFVGTDAELMGWTVLCDIDDPNERLQRGFTRTPTGLYLKVQPGHVGVMAPITDDFDRSKEVTREGFEAILRKVCGFDDVSVTNMTIASTYTDRAMQAATYRKGRIFLAGDSAHIHSPLGGQGMNAGIGDAMNLGWKLAAAVQGRVSPDSLDNFLDSYERERHPIGAWITSWTRAQVQTMKPTLQSQAVADLIRDLISTSGGSTFFTARFMGVLQKYDLSQGGDKAMHPIVGTSVPDFNFLNGSGRLGDMMRSGRGLLIDFGDEDSELGSLCQGWSDRLDYVRERAQTELGFRALLVRPDGIVAWATEGELNVEEVKQSLSRWYGPKKE